MALKPKYSPAQRRLAAALMAAGFTDLFERATYEALDRFWNAPRGPRALQAVAESAASPPAAAFLAAEILSLKGAYAPPARARRKLAAAYAAALAGNVAGSANPWGMPGELDGATGQHLVALGAPAIAALAPLLDDDRLLRYAGSREASTGNRSRYRVKDAAAFFIAQIRNQPWKLEKSRKARDTRIRTLKSELERGKR